MIVKGEKMNTEKIHAVMQNYVDTHEIAGGSLLVISEKEELFRGKWGYCDREAQKPVEYDNIFRLMSMTKPMVAVAVMICAERGLLDIDEPVSLYLPEFSDIQVNHDSKYANGPDAMKKLPLLLPFFKINKVKTQPASRGITARELLSHSSGMQQGTVGLLSFLKGVPQFQSLGEEVSYYAKQPLDFEPGTGTGYSPFAGFDVLGYLVEVVSGKRLEDFIREEICDPLEMYDTGFFLTKVKQDRLVKVYKRKGESLKDVTGTKNDMAGMMRQDAILFEHGCGGAYSTLDDYSHFARMLLCEGSYQGRQLLKPETVRLMRSEAPHEHLEPDPGFVWGLGMKIRQDPVKGNSPATPGTYGWSGAFGTHFFVSPDDGLAAVFMTNRSDLEGSASPVSRRIEEMVFEKDENV